MKLADVLKIWRSREFNKKELDRFYVWVDFQDPGSCDTFYMFNLGVVNIIANSLEAQGFPVTLDNIYQHLSNQCQYLSRLKYNNLKIKEAVTAVAEHNKDHYGIMILNSLPWFNEQRMRN